MIQTFGQGRHSVAAANKTLTLITAGITRTCSTIENEMSFSVIARNDDGAADEASSLNRATIKMLQ